MTVLRASRISTYVALGSSSTLGAGASRPDVTGYVALIGKALEVRFPGLEILNLGRSEDRMADIVARFDEVRSARPSLITVLPFTDFASTPIERFEKDMEALLDAVSELSAECVREGNTCHAFFGDLRIDPSYVGGAPDEPDAPGYRPSDYAMLTEKNATVARLAARRDAVTVVSVIDQNAIHPEWIGDDGHPNDLGHGYIAGRFLEEIEPWSARLAG